MVALLVGEFGETSSPPPALEKNAFGCCHVRAVEIKLFLMPSFWGKVYAVQQVELDPQGPSGPSLCLFEVKGLAHSSAGEGEKDREREPGP